ncbi:glycosyltransferase family 9 protein [Pigmentiphaga aceris]|uniref:Glycosyltransferase family 9 protein n=1 Tax=Pigmentiphaga aceris TaxID=1940612 RepID=A0A5C0AYB5_9BURK|nr:glycosyltransferase family 9 protein [Pigmentiphaga aceris]QEI07449.1 glycosyltransferase family 9 protein [Pigmentiphaga aceris]
MSKRPAPLPGSVLVIALRYIGDVLLTTPLAHALKQRDPSCQVDMLVFEGTQGILQNNPDLREVITVAQRPDRDAQIALIKRLWRRYDLVLVTLPGDRPHLYGWAASRNRLGFVPASAGQAWWKRLLLKKSLVLDSVMHRVAEGERLGQLMDLVDVRTVVPPTARMQPADWAERLRPHSPAGQDFDPAQAYAIVHPSPRWRYKQWHVEGWHALMNDLVARGMRIVLSGGPGQEESAYLDQLTAALPAHAKDAIIRVQGVLSLGELADLMHGAAIYIGPDTATTHLAAACNTPTVALYGPTDPRVWGPWPATGLDVDWQKAQAEQHRGKVILIQNPSLPCMPCQQEGCERHRGSRSDCLDTLPASEVLDAVQRLMHVSAGKHA